MTNFDIEIYLEESATYIQERIGITEQAQLQIGRKLLEVRAQIDDGLWTAWLKSHFDWSHSHANKLMQAAENAPKLMELDHSLIHRQALFMLAANCTPQEARDLALAYANAGQTVNKELAFLISRAHPSVLPRFESGELTDRQAYDLGIALKDVPDDCKDARGFAVEMEVASPWVVRYLADEYLKWVSYTQETDKIDSAWHDITHNKCLLIEDAPVSLRVANERDVARYIDWRRQGHIMDADDGGGGSEKTYHIKEEEYQVGEDGTLTLEDLPPGAYVLVSVWTES